MNSRQAMTGHGIRVVNGVHACARLASLSALEESFMNRRQLLPALFAALLLCGSAAAQTNVPLRYALLSAVGDQMTVVYARSTVGSRLDRNERESVSTPDRALDRLVLKRLDTALSSAAPAAQVAAFTAASAPILNLQRETLVGRQPPEAIAKAFAQALPVGGADRLLILQKHRAEASIPTDDGAIGQGRLEGVGFYVDRRTAVRSAKSGYSEGGFLAPFAYVRLVVADASGRVLAHRDIEAAETYAMGDTNAGLQPWDMLDSAAKVDALSSGGMDDFEIPAFLRKQAD